MDLRSKNNGFPEDVNILNILSKGEFIFESGSFGYLYRGIYKNRHVAVKAIKNSPYADDEWKYLLSFDNDFIIKGIFSCQVENILYMVMELADGDLSDYVKQLGPVADQTIFRAITFQIITGISQIHAKGLIHRDIKPSNILIVGNTIKICDFGLAVEVKNYPSSRKGTFSTMAPELTIEEHYDTAVDIWSLGVVLYFIRTGVYPYTSSRIITKMLENMVGKIAFTGSIESKVKQFLDTREVQFATKTTIFEEQSVYYRHQHLIKCCLQPEAEKRHTAVQLLTHRVFKDLRDEDFHKIPRYCIK